MDNNTKLEAFRLAISQQAQDEAVSLTEEMRSRRKASRKYKNELATVAVLTRLRNDMSRREAAFRREMSRCEYDTKKAILRHRNELIESFFVQTEDKLKDFVCSDQYQDFLKRSLEKIRAAIALDNATLIYARVCDVDAVRALTSCEVAADNSIKLGGLRAVCRVKNMLCDVTLDMALIEEKKRFTEKTELRL
ncbi:MAG: hypothetical protein IJZ95_00565 [Oscillospiraceae bacterium]|nr:hypothetical protein [Oscillospiraceae bacterium]